MQFILLIKKIKIKINSIKTFETGKRMQLNRNLTDSI